MYSFSFTSKLSQYGRDNYLMHIYLDGVIIESRFIEVLVGTTQDLLDSIANEVIDYLEGING